MQVHRVCLHGDGAGEIEFAVDLGAVVAVGEMVGAVGNCGDAGAHFAFGVILQGGAGLQDGFPAVFGA